SPARVEGHRSADRRVPRRSTAMLYRTERGRAALRDAPRGVPGLLHRAATTSASVDGAVPSNATVDALQAIFRDDPALLRSQTGAGREGPAALIDHRSAEHHGTRG